MTHMINISTSNKGYSKLINCNKIPYSKFSDDVKFTLIDWNWIGTKYIVTTN